MSPSVGRVVHFVDDAGQLRPAIVVAVNDGGSVDLEVFGQVAGKERWPVMVLQATSEHGGERGRWSWPPRV